jgi:hypothetical protein
VPRGAQGEVVRRDRSSEPLISLEPALGLEPLTCALRERSPHRRLSRLQSHLLREARQFAYPGSHPSHQMREWTRMMTSRAVMVLSNGPEVIPWDHTVGCRAGHR